MLSIILSSLIEVAQNLHSRGHTQFYLHTYKMQFTKKNISVNSSI